MDIKDSHGKFSLNDCRMILLDHIGSTNGILTVAANGELPFEVRRVYYLFDIPSGALRGGHSHRSEHRLIVAVTGCFDVKLDDGHTSKIFTLRTPFEALYIPPGIWRSISGFSSGAVALGLCSSSYSEADYVRDYSDFLSLALR